MANFQICGDLISSINSPQEIGKYVPPPGALRYVGVHMCENNGLKYRSYPKHILTMIQKSPLNKDFVGFCLKFDLLNRFESEEFE